MKAQIAGFQIDATPPIGTPLCFGSCGLAKTIVAPLTARGVILWAEQWPPVVLCAVDWLGIGNDSHDAWRQALAEAVGTDTERVAVHTLHLHDAPGTDLEASRLLAEWGFPDDLPVCEFERGVIARAAEAARQAKGRPRPVTHIGVGKSRVFQFASNRRILGADGKVQWTRWSSCEQDDLRLRPEGVVDPYVRQMCFWEEQSPVAILTYYASHPQSFYGRGAVSPDTVGLARGLREATIPAALHLHFDGAGGNVAAGKYNDGTPPVRFELARRLAEGMEAAWNGAVRLPMASLDMQWRVKTVALPLARRLQKQADDRPDAQANMASRRGMARDINFARRVRSGRRIDLTCLRIGPVSMLHMPGELFVEYQLAAQDMRPGELVCMAAYGDYGPGYIGTRIAYEQGGYEPSQSRVAPDVEDLLLSGIRDLLK